MTPENDPAKPLSFVNPATGLFYHKTEAKSGTRLDDIERDKSTQRLKQLLHPQGKGLPAPIPRPQLPAAFDENYVRHMHSFLFQDVYQWAGETRADRNFQGQKDASYEGYKMSYAHYKRISPDIAAVSSQLDQENNLRGLSKEQFVKRAAYYMDHYNHIHSFAEGNGRTVQAVFFELGRQAGYKLNLSIEHREFNPARDEALTGRSQNPQANISRLEGLIRRHLKDWPGKEAEALRHPSQAQPLSSPTPEVARIEALRELKASSQAVNIRLNELRGTTPLDPMHDAFFVNLQRTIMAKPESIGALAPAMHRQTNEAATAHGSISNGPAQLDRFRRAIDHTAKLFEGHGQQQQILPSAVLDKLQKGEKKLDPAGDAPKQKDPQQKRRGPRM